MPKIVRNEIEYSSTTSTANQVQYNNTVSGLSATNVQGAIDEIAGDIPTNATELPISSGSSTNTKAYIDNGLQAKKVWSGTKYQADDYVDIPNFDKTRFYVLEFVAYTGQDWRIYQLIYGGQASLQVYFWGDNTQFCRYRLTLNQTTGRLTIFDSLNGASNTALVGIYLI